MSCEILQRIETTRDEGRIRISLVTLRLVEKNDFDAFYKLKSEAFNLFWMGHDSPSARGGLQKWFDNIWNIRTEN